MANLRPSALPNTKTSATITSDYIILVDKAGGDCAKMTIAEFFKYFGIQTDATELLLSDISDTNKGVASNINNILNNIEQIFTQLFNTNNPIFFRNSYQEIFAITSMVENDIAIVNDSTNAAYRNVYQYISGSWTFLYNLDEQPAAANLSRIELTYLGGEVVEFEQPDSTNYIDFMAGEFEYSFENSGSLVPINKICLLGGEFNSLVTIEIFDNLNRIFELGFVVLYANSLNYFSFLPRDFETGHTWLIRIHTPLGGTLYTKGILAGAFVQLIQSTTAGTSFVECKETLVEINKPLLLTDYAGNPDKFLQLDVDGKVIAAEIVISTELNDLSDVLLTTPAAGQIMYFDGTKWININKYPIDYGFVDNAESTIAFDNGTNIFTIAKVGADFQFFRNGVWCKILANKTATLTAADGTYYIYTDANNGTLTASTGGWDILSTKVFVSIIIRRLTKVPTYLMLEERHTVAVNRTLHFLYHSKGAEVISTVTVNYTIAPSTPSNANNCFGVTGDGTLSDDGLFSTIAGFAKPTGTVATYLVVYRSAVGTFTWDGDQNLPFKNSATYIQYDLNGVLTTLSSSEFMNVWLLATNIKNVNGWIVVIGQAKFSSNTLAYAESWLSVDKTGLPASEFVVTHQLTYGTSSGYSTTGKCKLLRIERVSFNTSSVAVAPPTTAAATSYINTTSLTAAGNVQIAIDNVYTALESCKIPINPTSLGSVGYVFDNAANAKSTKLGLKCLVNGCKLLDVSVTVADTASQVTQTMIMKVTKRVNGVDTDISTTTTNVVVIGNAKRTTGVIVDLYSNLNQSLNSFDAGDEVHLYVSTASGFGTGGDSIVGSFNFKFGK